MTEPGHKKVIAVGAARSGTTSLARFFHNHGVISRHQHFDPDSIVMKPYNLENPPDEVADYVKRKTDAVMTGTTTIIKRGKTEPYKNTPVPYGFEASYTQSFYMYLLSKTIPHTEWLVIIRDPAECANSLKKFLSFLRDKDSRVLKGIVLFWSQLYLFILEQAAKMKSPPRWMSFEKYIQGAYNEKLLDLFDMEMNQERADISQEILRKKFNANREYTILDCPLYEEDIHYHITKQSVFDFAWQVRRVLENTLEEL